MRAVARRLKSFHPCRGKQEAMADQTGTRTQEPLGGSWGPCTARALRPAALGGEVSWSWERPLPIRVTAFHVCWMQPPLPQNLQSGPSRTAKAGPRVSEAVAATLPDSAGQPAHGPGGRAEEEVTGWGEARGPLCPHRQVSAMGEPVDLEGDQLQAIWVPRSQSDHSCI